MKRSFILVSSIVGFLVLITPYILGVLIEKQLNSVFANIARITDQKDSFVDVDFSSINIKRGWFTSKVNVDGKLYPKNIKGIILGGIASGFKKTGNAFNIELDIWHGPLLFIYNTDTRDKLGLALLESQINLDVKSSRNRVEVIPIKIQSSISYSGNLNHSLLLPAHKQRVNKMLSFKFLDLDLDFYHSADFSEYKINLDVDELKLIHIILGEIVVKDINLHEEYAREGEKYSFNRTVLADEILLSSIDGSKLSIDEFSQEVVLSVIQDDLADIYIFLSINRLTSPFGKYGHSSVGFNGEHFYLKPIKTFLEKISDREIVFSSELFFDNIGKSLTDSSTIKISPVKFTSGKGVLAVKGVVNPKYPWPKNLKSVKSMWELADRINLDMSASKELTQEIVKYFMILDKRKELLSKADHSDPKKYLRSQDITVKDEDVFAQVNEWESAGLLNLENKNYNVKFNFINGAFSFNGNVL